MRRSFPDTLEIALIERAPVALWCESESCFLIDKDSVIFQKAQSETGLIKISGEKEMLDKEKLLKFWISKPNCRPWPELRRPRPLLFLENG